MYLGGIKSHIKAFELHLLDDQRELLPEGHLYTLCAVYECMCFGNNIIMDGNNLTSF